MDAVEAPTVRCVRGYMVGPRLSRRRPMSRRELYREQCQDEDGDRFVVIVWQNKPSLSTVSYSLEDGTPVHYEDECYFATPSGKMLTRCQD